MIQMTIHVSIPSEATEEEIERVHDFLGGLFDLERGQWDPFIYAHSGDCPSSDHCMGDGSNYQKGRTS